MLIYTQTTPILFFIIWVGLGLDFEITDIDSKYQADLSVSIVLSIRMHIAETCLWLGQRSELDIFVQGLSKCLLQGANTDSCYDVAVGGKTCFCCNLKAK